MGFWLIKKIIKENDYVIYSDAVLEELQKYYSAEDVKNIFSLVPEQNLLKVTTSATQLREADFLAKRLEIPRKDALHAILARDNEAIMVSRDHHYDALARIVETRKPEDLI